MMTLVTGTPGAGKTLNTIKMVHQEILKKPFFEKKDSEDGITEKYNREVYACNINGIDTEKSGFKILEDPRKWTSLPAGSILIIDEASDFYPTSKKFGEELEDDIAELRKHRHYGIDIFYITQQPGLINKNIRILCGEHIHYQRPRSGKITMRYTNSAVFDTDSKFLRYAEQNGASKEKVVLDKKYFSFYKSTEVDTHKSKVPWKILFFKIGLPIILAIGSVTFLFSTFADSKEKYSSSVASSDSSQEKSREAFQLPQDALAGSIMRSRELTKEQYQEQLKPRIPFHIETAPVYDDVYKPVTYPKLKGCFKFEDDSTCECFTQQATTYKVPISMCLEYVQGKMKFDYAVPDKRT